MSSQNSKAREAHIGNQKWWDSLWEDASLSLDAGRRSLVLPQLGIPGFVDSHGRPYPFLGVCRGKGEMRLGEGTGGEEGGETVIAM